MLLGNASRISRHQYHSDLTWSDTSYIFAAPNVYAYDIIDMWTIQNGGTANRYTLALWFKVSDLSSEYDSSNYTVHIMGTGTGECGFQFHRQSYAVMLRLPGFITSAFSSTGFLLPAAADSNITSANSADYTPAWGLVFFSVSNGQLTVKCYSPFEPIGYARIYTSANASRWDNFTSADTAVPIVIGSSGNTNDQTVNIAEFGIWNKQLTNDEMTALYNSGEFLDFETTSGDYGASEVSALKHYWRFGDGSGDSNASGSSFHMNDEAPGNTDIEASTGDIEISGGIGS